jgi:hypothetical protein
LELLEQCKHKVFAVRLLTLQDLDVGDGYERKVLNTLLHNLLSKVIPSFPLAACKNFPVLVADLVEPEIRVDDLDQTEADHEAADCDLEVFNGIVEIHIDANDLFVID